MDTTSPSEGGGTGSIPVEGTMKKIHFIGIGGIGISAIARMMLLQGKKVSGSDTAASPIIKELKKLGARVYSGHKAGNLKSADLVIYTLAISKDNPELKKAEKLKIPVLTYPQALGLISKDKFTIAVSGTHGKTTTTAMIGKILMDAKLDPSMVVGSLLKDQKSNFIAGKSPYFVCEACEYKRSFLNLNPKIIVITNIDNDHLDYYRNLKDIQSAFSEFVSKLPPDGFLVCNPNDKNLRPVVRGAKCRIIDYSGRRAGFLLKVPGAHNILNAKAALAVAGILGINKKIAANSLSGYSGVWRRFEYRGRAKNGALIYDDYAHHPAEIKATLAAARDYFGKKRIFTVFQPHLFSRTRLLQKDFARSFNDSDFVIVTDIYAAREKNDGTHAKDLVLKMKKHHPNAIYISKFPDIKEFLDKQTKKNDIIITMGAGNIYKLYEN